jgi:hypothetical protein
MGQLAIQCLCLLKPPIEAPNHPKPKANIWVVKLKPMLPQKIANHPYLGNSGILTHTHLKGGRTMSEKISQMKSVMRIGITGETISACHSNGSRC